MSAFYAAVMLRSTADESRRVAEVGQTFFESMFDVAGLILRGEFHDGRRTSWDGEQVEWDHVCEAWDSLSDRLRLPLVGY
jgi:hypothetical protein